MDWLQVICWFSLGLFGAIQLLHTLSNINRWPFPAQNMFSHNLPAEVPRLMVKLHDSQGVTQVVFPYSVLPVEFFRAQRILCQVYLENDDFALQDQFAYEVLKRLNEAPWGSYDEVEPSARPSPGATFVGLELAHYDYLVDAYLPGRELSSIQRPGQIYYSVHFGPQTVEPDRGGENFATDTFSEPLQSSSMSEL
jgi:hypothetical protein